MEGSIKKIKVAVVKLEEKKKQGFATYDERINSLEGELSSLKSKHEGT